jgi:hypothetical protein
MMQKAKSALCSEVQTKHSRQIEYHVELLNIKPGGTLRKRYTLKG